MTQTKNYVARASATDDRYQLAWSGYRATRHPRDLDIDPAQARTIIAAAIRPLAALVDAQGRHLDALARGRLGRTSR